MLLLHITSWGENLNWYFRIETWFDSTADKTKRFSLQPSWGVYRKVVTEHADMACHIGVFVTK